MVNLGRLDMIEEEASGIRKRGNVAVTSSKQKEHKGHPVYVFEIVQVDTSRPMLYCRERVICQCLTDDLLKMCKEVDADLRELQALDVPCVPLVDMKGLQCKRKGKEGFTVDEVHVYRQWGLPSTRRHVDMWAAQRRATGEHSRCGVCWCTQGKELQAKWGSNG